MKQYLFLLFVLILVNLVACGSDTEYVYDNEDTEVFGFEDSEYIDNGEDMEIFGFEDSGYLDDNQNLVILSDFEEDRAWIQYGILDSITALIDKEGNIIWESDVKLEELSSFKDGHAYMRLDGGELDNYIIINSEGNITWSKECDENYVILGHGDGVFLVAEHILSFDTNEWRIGAIDEEGNIIIPFKAYKTTIPFYGDTNPYVYEKYEARAISFDEFNYRCIYQGEGIFELILVHKETNSFIIDILLNVHSQKVIYTFDSRAFYPGYSVEFMTKFENGMSNIWLKKPEGLIPCKFSQEGSIVKFSDVDIWNNILSDANIYGPVYGNELICTGKSYYNLQGECVIDFPQYQDKYEYRCKAFVGGYAAMDIVGVDEKNYITLIDENGEFVFEPTDEYGQVVVTDANYLIAFKEGCFTVLNVNGDKLYSLECDCIEYPEGSDRSLSDGVFRYKDFYLNLELGNVIGKHKDDMTLMSY